MQELYLSGEDQVADASYDVEYSEYEEPEPRVEPYRRRRRPYRRRRKNKQPPSQDFYAGADTDRDSQYKPPTSGYQVPDSYEEPSSYDAPPYDGYDAPSYAASSPSYGAPSYSGYVDGMETGTNISGMDGGVGRGGYWQYRGMGEDGQRRQGDYGNYDYRDYGGFEEEKEEEPKEVEESMFSKAMQYFTGGYIGSRGDECLDEYCDYYDEPM